MEYDVTFDVQIQVSRTITADTLDDALAKARKMDTPSAIFQPKVKIAYLDGDIAVKGIYEL